MVREIWDCMAREASEWIYQVNTKFNEQSNNSWSIYMTEDVVVLDVDRDTVPTRNCCHRKDIGGCGLLHS